MMFIKYTRRLLLLSILLFSGCILFATPLTDSLKPRIIVLTDISPDNIEPDDMESLIHLLVYADQFEIDGLVATTGWSSGGNNANWVNLIYNAINAYEKDLPNLLKRSNQNGFLPDESHQKIGYWPSADYLRSHTVVGSQKRGMKYIGKGNDSPGSNLIIKMADRKDKRPVWILAWGGANTLAQAIWQVRENRSKQQLDSFLHKIRVYTITDQDRGQNTPYSVSSQQWMRGEFKNDLFFIWDECAWKYQSGTGRNKWAEYATHIQDHGALGSMYPKYKYGVEGDTPSFLYVLPNGLNNPEHPGYGGWGGFFEWSISPDDKTYAYTNYKKQTYTVCKKYEQYFLQAMFNDFAARMDWAKDGIGNRNPIVVINGDSSIADFMITSVQGSSVILNASESYDPDGDNLIYTWYVLSDVERYKRDNILIGKNKSRVKVKIPVGFSGGDIHVICEARDNGHPNLTSYRRIIIKMI